MQLVLLRRNGHGLARPALAGSTAILFYLASASATLGDLPNGDIDGDGRLDAGDLLRAQRALEGELSLIAEELERADVAPLEGPADGTLDPADLLLLFRAARNDDIDGDGLGTRAELDAGASPFRSDSDSDGLDDGAEIALGTDPGNADSDGDGVEDSVEASLGTDPSRADTDGDGLGDFDDPEPLTGVIYRFTDHLTSTTSRWQADGTLIERVVYQPFGSARSSTGGPAQIPDFGFTGQRLEAGIGIYDYGARWYDPNLGRFLQPDSIVPNPGDPQSLNRYSYVRNNPVSRVDPTGYYDYGTLGGESSFGLSIFNEGNSIYADIQNQIASTLGGYSSGFSAQYGGYASSFSADPWSGFSSPYSSGLGGGYWDGSSQSGTSAQDRILLGEGSCIGCDRTQLSCVSGHSGAGPLQ